MLDTGAGTGVVDGATSRPGRDGSSATQPRLTAGVSPSVGLPRVSCRARGDPPVPGQRFQLRRRTLSAGRALAAGSLLLYRMP